jgi:THO complex subunit 2
MAVIRQKYASSGTSRSGPSNALANSVLLDDEAGPADTAADPSAPPARPPPEQRIQLVQALLAIGHMPAALYFLGKYPWLAQYSPTISDLILRIVEHGIEDLYARHSDTWSHAGMDVEDLRLDAAAPTYKVPRRDVVPTVLAPIPPDTPTAAFVFFYPDWAADIEKWTDISEIRTKGMRWLSLVRGLGGRRVETIVRICRIGAGYFAELQKVKEADLGLSGKDRTRKQVRDVLVSSF